jgi:hypothetical protein
MISIGGKKEREKIPHNLEKIPRDIIEKSI